MRVPDNENPDDYLKSCLLCPQKFIAISPKKLIFSDDGSFVWKGMSDAAVYLPNRIVSIDLEEETLKINSKYVPVNFVNGVNYNLSMYDVKNYTPVSQ